MIGIARRMLGKIGTSELHTIIDRFIIFAWKVLRYTHAKYKDTEGFICTRKLQSYYFAMVERTNWEVEKLH
jgi:hypothetical protein